jgi:glutamyl-Q tRNA(Asp) synthetase
VPVKGGCVKIVTRFAPSPTGRLHLGHAYSALLAHRFARESGGTFLLRIEESIRGVRARSMSPASSKTSPGSVSIGDGPVVRQSERLHLYRAALERLTETRSRLPLLLHPIGNRSRDRPQGRSAAWVQRRRLSPAPAAPPVIPTEAGAQELRRRRPWAPAFAGVDVSVRTPAWRLDMRRAVEALGNLTWHDATAGEVVADPPRFGDVVLARKDAPTSYHLAVTIDDAAQGVTDVVRGRDLFAATDVHRLLQALLGLPTPRYRHHPLLAGPDGKRLAKRHGAPTLADLCASGADPEKLARDLLGGRPPAGYSAVAS